MFVEIRNGKANPIKINPDKVAELQEAGLEIIDVTDIIPQPQAGWLYDGENFTEPEIEKITRIANEALWDRFTEDEQTSLLGSANNKIMRFLHELGIRPRVDLSNQQVINAINALETAGIIGAGRADEILEVK